MKVEPMWVELRVGLSRSRKMMVGLRMVGLWVVGLLRWVEQSRLGEICVDVCEAEWILFVVVHSYSISRGGLREVVMRMMRMRSLT